MLLTLENPVFQTFVLAAALICLKPMLQGYVTVFRMMRAGGGCLNPEDAQKTFGNPNASPEQLDKNEYVNRSRRMHNNDTENLPIYLVASFLFTVANPPLILAQSLMYGYVASRLLHLWAYGTAKQHEVRATFFAIGSLIVVFMAIYSFIAALP